MRPGTENNLFFRTFKDRPALQDGLFISSYYLILHFCK